MDPFDIHKAPPFRFFVVFNKLNKTLQGILKEHFNEHQLTSTEFAVLDALATHQKLPIQEIGSIVLITSGAITHVLRGLEKKGLVKREQATTDKRMYYAQLTEEGKSFWEAYVPHHQQFIRNLFREFDLNELTQITELLKKLGLYLTNQSQEDNKGEK